MIGPQKDSWEFEIFDFVPQFRDSNDQLRIRIFDLPGELVDRVEGVGSGGDGADSDDAEEAQRELDRIRGEDEDDVVLGDAESKKGAGDSGDGGFEVGERKGFGGIGVDEGRFVRIRGRVSEEECDHGEVGVFGEHKRRPKRPEDAISAVPRFFH
jgi:hypothetical protein